MPLRLLRGLLKLNSVRVFLIASLFFNSCTQEEAPLNWQHLDLKDDGVFGISTDKAYKELLKGKQSTTVIVAVLDGGTDTAHEDLRSILWVNKKEIPGNGVDEDNNGYTDDLHGWNFAGSSKGSISFDNTELTRLVRRDAARFGDKKMAAIPVEDRTDFEHYQKNKADLEKKQIEAKDGLVLCQKIKAALDSVVKELGKENPRLEDFRSFMPKNDLENQVRSFLNVKMKRKTFKEVYQEDIVETMERFQNELDYCLNVAFNPRPEVTINHESRFYGNNDVAGPDATHGSHVAGIIGAVRTNKTGIQGIADNVRIMVVRSGPKGDERDEDVASAIRYAVDNGAKIINMSFGKAYSWDKSIVDEAVNYAVSKDVLLIHAAGNDNKDLEKEPCFPNPYYLAGGKVPCWITVGASDKANDETLRASFSNYGKTQVDVFAPGVRINSTVPGSKYKRLDGTSMAAPVVAGLAALIRSYYPALTAIQVKDIIMKSVIKVDQLKERCVSGGVVNAYTALQLAEEYKTSNKKN